jgi:hypothetical protein
MSHAEPGGWSPPGPAPLCDSEGAGHAGATSRPEFAAAVREFLLAHRTSTSSGGR